MQRKSELTFLNSVINYETENFSVLLFSAITLQYNDPSLFT